MCRRGFTLIEMCVVVLVLGILLAVAVPSWQSARERSRQQACFKSLRAIDDAKQRCVMENRLHPDDEITEDMLFPKYLQGEDARRCPSSGEYTIGSGNQRSECSVHGFQ